MILGVLINSGIIAPSTWWTTIHLQSFPLLHGTLSESTTWFTSMVNMSVIYLCLWKSLDGTSIRPNLNIFIMYIFRLSISDGLPNFFCLFFLVFRNTPVPPSWWMPSNGQKFFFYICFLSLAILMTIVPLNNHISSHGPICCSLKNQLGTYFNNHGLSRTASLHISCVLKWSGMSTCMGCPQLPRCTSPGP